MFRNPVTFLLFFLYFTTALAEGNRAPFDQLRGMLVTFAPNFEILPGTAAKTPSKGLKPFEVPDLAPPDAAGD